MHLRRWCRPLGTHPTDDEEGYKNKMNPNPHFLKIQIKYLYAVDQSYILRDFTLHNNGYMVVTCMEQEGEKNDHQTTEGGLPLVVEMKLLW